MFLGKFPTKNLCLENIFVLSEGLTTGSFATFFDILKIENQVKNNLMIASRIFFLVQIEDSSEIRTSLFQFLVKLHGSFFLFPPFYSSQENGPFTKF